MVAGMPGGVMVSDLEGEGEQRGVWDGSMCPASSACVVWKFIVIVGGPGWKCGGPTYCLFAQPHGEVHYVVRRRWMIEHKQQVFMRRSIVSLLLEEPSFLVGPGMYGSMAWVLQYVVHSCTMP